MSNEKKRILSDEEILKVWKKAESIFNFGLSVEQATFTQKSQKELVAGSTLNGTGEQVGLNEALIHATDLVDDMQNEEYTRGICELIARLFPVDDVCTSVRAEWVKQAIVSRTSEGAAQKQCVSTH